VVPGNVPGKTSWLNGKFAHDMGRPLRLSSRQVGVVGISLTIHIRRSFL